MQGKTIEEIKIGDKAYFEKVLTDEDIRKFAEVSGDANPVHLDDKAAEKSVFKTRIAHGMLAASLISAVIGNQLPGEGTIYLNQNIKFLKPVKINDQISAQVIVLEKDEKKNRVKLQTDCYNIKKEKVIEGTALVMPPKA